LIQWRLVSDQIQTDQTRPCLQHRSRRHRQQSRQARFPVITHTVCVAHSDQHQVQRQGVHVTALDVPLAHQPLIDPTKLRWNPSQPIGAQHSLVGHGVVDPRGCPARVLATRGWRWRCRLVAQSRSNERSAQSIQGLGTEARLVAHGESDLQGFQRLAVPVRLVAQRRLHAGESANTPDAPPARPAPAPRAPGPLK
jgi:hypothetical protein